MDAIVVRGSALSGGGPQTPNWKELTVKIRNPLARLTAVIAFALPLCPSSHGAEGPPSNRAAESKGTVTGRVQNALSGNYLNNARVTIRGTDRSVFTNEEGTYLISDAPAGEIVLDIFYTGLDPQTVTLNVPAGQSVERDVQLSSGALRGAAASVVKLDSFVVASSRETDAMAIANNEQRFASNVKLVVAADSFGDVMDGNVAEMMKFLPGVTALYDRSGDQTAAARISVRGFSPGMVSISTDGAQLANTSNVTGNSRFFDFSQMSINNLARIEITKVPTPANPADSMGGSVNMVSKSAFERQGASLNYNFDFTASSHRLQLHRTAHLNDEKMFKIRPGAQFDYTLPLSKNFGLVITGGARSKYVENQERRTTYNATLAGSGASPAKPYLQIDDATNILAIFTRYSAGVKADWRLQRNSVLSLGVQGTYSTYDQLPTKFIANLGTNATPTPANGTPLTFGPDFASGPTGRGSVTLASGASIQINKNNLGSNLHYRFDDGNWRILAGANHSTAKLWLRDTHSGHFRQLGVALAEPARVVFSNITSLRPGKIQAFNNANQEIDLSNVNSYRLSSANSTPRDSDDIIDGANLDVRKQLRFLPVPAAVQLGGRTKTHTRDTRRQNTTWTYNGLNGSFSPAPYLSLVYKNDATGPRSDGVTTPQISPALVWEAYAQNPALFTVTPAQFVASETFAIRNSELVEENVSALYGQAEVKLWGRMQVLGGVRYEKTTTEGRGALSDPAAEFQRNANGTFVRNAAGARIRKPEAGAVGSIEALRLTLKERAAQASRSYDGYYPSLHVNHNLADNLILRLAYARTYGRPDFTDIIPNTDIAEDDNPSNPTTTTGRITVRNTGLKPWHADNYDLSLEYYTRAGGLISVGAFQKNITDFFGTLVKVITPQDAEELELDSRYVGWTVSTQFNSGDARVRGVEINFKQSFEHTGGWGRHFSVFLNGTKLKTEGNQLASFSEFIPESANWGFSFKKNPIIFMAKWNYRGTQTGTAQPTLGPDAFLYEDARLTLDLNIIALTRKRLSFFTNVQNVFNAQQLTLARGSLTPHYASRRLTSTSGTTIIAGIKGTF
jgi:iron complex outermembrane recepter protein